MPENLSEAVVKLETRLSVRDRLLAEQLKERIANIGDNPFLALIGVDSETLGEAVRVWLVENKDILTKDYCPGSPYSFDDFMKRINQLEKDFLHIVCLFTKNLPEAEAIAPNLIFNRDYIPQHRLKIVFIMSRELLKTVIEKAYDFYAIAGFSCFLEDMLHKTETDLAHREVKPKELLYYENAIEELEAFRQTSTTRNDDILLTNLFRAASAAQDISRLDEALNLYLEALPLAEEQDKALSRSAILGNIGIIYQDKGELDEALKYYRPALEIFKQISYLQGEASIIGNIGLIYKDKGELDEALKYYRQALEIDKQIGHIQGEASELGNIGNIYNNKGELDEALKYLRQALEIDKQIGYLQGEASIIGNIGIIYKNKGELDEALKYYKQALVIFKQIGYIQGEANQLGNIGFIYKDKGELDEALEYYKQALEIFKQIGYLQGEALALDNIGDIYQSKGEIDEALKYHSQALEIDKQIKN